MHRLTALTLSCGFACGGDDVPTAADPSTSASTGGELSTDSVTSSTSDPSTSTSGEPESTTSGAPNRQPDCDPEWYSGERHNLDLWHRVFGPLNWSASYADRPKLAVGPLAQVYAVGTAELRDYTRDGWVHALSSEGLSAWTDRYEGSGGWTDQLRDVVVDPAGNVVVVGVEQTNAIRWVDYVEYDYVFVVLSYGPDGTRRWRQTLPEPDASFVDGGSAAIGPDGQISVAYTVTYESWPQLALGELESSGTLLDQRVEDLPGYRGAYFPVADIAPDGALYVAMRSNPTDSSGEHVVSARWDAGGQLDWLVGESFERTRVVGLAADDNGIVVLADFGMGVNPSATNFPWLTRYDAAGLTQWALTLDEGPSLVARSLIVDCSHEIIALVADPTESWLARVSPDGDLLEMSMIGVPAVEDHFDIAEDPAGNIVVAGESCDGLHCDLLVRKLAR